MNINKCLAAGTKITLADGSTKNIENLTVGESLRSSSTNQVIKSTTIGRETNPIFQITTGNGKSVQMTSDHPAITEQGAVLAHKLSVGDTIFTDEGTSAVASISTHAYSGTVHNINLANAGAGNVDPTNFYANGILVGDMNTQHDAIQQYKNFNNQSTQTPADWHTDIKNRFGDI